MLGLLVVARAPLCAQGAPTPWLVSARMPGTLTSVADFPRDVAARITELERALWAPGASWYWRLGVGALLTNAADSTLPRSRLDAVVATLGEYGTFRRSLEPPSSQRVLAGVSGWQRPTRGTMLVGAAQVTQSTYAVGSMGDDDASYGSSPFALADSSGSSVDRLDARFSGAAATRLGAVTVGAQAEYASWQRNSRLSGLARLARGDEQSVALSVRADHLPLLRPFVMLGWRGGSETRRLVLVSKDGAQYTLFGLADVPGALVGLPGYYSRVEDGEPFGSVGFDAGGAGPWSAAGEWRHARRSQTQFRQEVDDPARDRWSPTMDDASLWLRWTPPATGVELGVVARHARLDGSATRASDSTNARFTATERRDVLALTAVGRPADAWQYGVGVAFERFAQQRANTVPVHVLDLTTTTLLWDGWAERRMADRWTVRARLLYSTSRADGTIPPYARPGSAYALFVAPDLAVDARDGARAHALLRVGYRLRAGVDVWASVATDVRSAQGESVFGPAAPSGSRGVSVVAAGVTRELP